MPPPVGSARSRGCTARTRTVTGWAIYQPGPRGYPRPRMKEDHRVAIIGLGYVGLPLGLAFRDAGLDVVGYESNPERLSSLREGRSPVDDVSDGRLLDALAGGLALCSP